MNNDIEREAFEMTMSGILSDPCFDRHRDGTYESNEMYIASLAWQAARELSSEPVGDICEFDGDHFINMDDDTLRSLPVGAKLYTQTPSAETESYPDCDTCGGSMDYMPWHYATENERHLHACNDCWPKVNPAKNMSRPPVAYAVHMGGGVIELHHAPLPEFDGKPHVAVPLFTEGDTWLDAINMFTASVLFPPGKTEGPGND